MILELAAGLAGITIVTVNPALRPQELAYVLDQSQADGIFLIPAYRGSQMGEMVRQVRADLPASPVIMQTSRRDNAEDRAQTVGRPLPQTGLKIIDPDSGQTVAPGVTGELCTRGYHVMTGYFRDPE